VVVMCSAFAWQSGCAPVHGRRVVFASLNGSGRNRGDAELEGKGAPRASRVGSAPSTCEARVAATFFPKSGFRAFVLPIREESCRCHSF
jgi:hypothetical protein